MFLILRYICMYMWLYDDYVMFFVCFVGFDKCVMCILKLVGYFFFKLYIFRFKVVCDML